MNALPTFHPSNSMQMNQAPQEHPRFVPTQQIANNQRINIAVGNLRKQGSINYDDGVPASPANSNVQFADQNRNVNNSFQIQQMQNPFAAHNQV
jgi:hypothetical protein